MQAVFVSRLIVVEAAGSIAFFDIRRLLPRALTQARADRVHLLDLRTLAARDVGAERDQFRIVEGCFPAHEDCT